MIYIEQFQTLTSIPEKLNSGDKLMTLTDEGLSVKNTKTGKEILYQRGCAPLRRISKSHLPMVCLIQ